MTNIISIIKHMKLPDKSKYDKTFLNKGEYRVAIELDSLLSQKASFQNAWLLILFMWTQGDGAEAVMDVQLSTKGRVYFVAGR